jgi:ATP-dependent RNA helicase DHX36
MAVHVIHSWSALSILQSRACLQILEAIAENQVILVSGETGCGKTTQVPQYILEASLGAGQHCRILVSQPRRLSAVSVATRVAAERGDSQVGKSVGYKIRLESVGTQATPLRFMTSGVLLKILINPEALYGVTHIVVDEVHERDKFADFALILLKDLLPSRPGLRVVLMSATLQTDLFSGFFGKCPVLSIPGFTYPVHDYFLEDILALVGRSGAVRVYFYSSRSPHILCYPALE